MAFYGPDQAAIHHGHFGDLAVSASQLVLARLHEADIASGKVVDLGCGSGILARAMGEAGHAVIGVDISEAMVELARLNAPLARFVVGSIFDVEIPRADAVAATGEVLNYAIDPRAGLGALESVAGRVRESLEPRGVFVFDVATPGRGGPTGAYDQFFDHGSWAMGVRVRESTDGAMLERHMTIFRKQSRPKGLFSRPDPEAFGRIDEHHVLHLYEPFAVEERLRAAGFEAIEIRDAYGAAPTSTPSAGWKVFVARAG